MSAVRNVSLFMERGLRKITCANFTVECKSVNLDVICNIRYMACILGWRKGLSQFSNIVVYDWKKGSEKRTNKREIMSFPIFVL